MHRRWLRTRLTLVMGLVVMSTGHAVAKEQIGFGHAWFEPQAIKWLDGEFLPDFQKAAGIGVDAIDTISSVGAYLLTSTSAHRSYLSSWSPLPGVS